MDSPHDLPRSCHCFPCFTHLLRCPRRLRRQQHQRWNGYRCAWPHLFARHQRQFDLFPHHNCRISLYTQTLTFTNTGTGTLSLSNVTVSGTNSAYFNESATTCGSSLAPAANCTASIVFTPAGSGSATALFSVTDNAASSPQTIALSGTGNSSATANATIDCSVAANLCPNTFTTTALTSDPVAAGGFHGYADPSERKDPNSTAIYYAYSWAHSLSDGTHVVDLHLAQSLTSGSTFSYVGPLYQSTQVTQTGSTAYSSINDTSTETVDLLPIPLTGTSAGQTLWVEAHQSYLVAPQSGIYDQLNATSEIVVTAVQLANPASPGAGTSLLALGSPSTPQALLAAVSTDPTRNPTQNLASLSPAAAKCGNWGQAALWYQSGTLYLAVECTEITGNGNLDGNELAHFLYSTTPAGSDASKWAWAYVGEFLTGAQAAKLGTIEGVPYAFFTEPEFALTRGGQLVLLATPSVFAPQTSQQPVIQYGCRVIPVSSLSPSGIRLDTDATTGAPVVTAKITENDLYTSPNEGPAACTYEPAAFNGIVMGRKFENDPTLGFYLYPVNSLITP
jgi:hypothetical protein